MAQVGAKLTITSKLSWTPASGDTITFTNTETLVQVGTNASMVTQTIDTNGEQLQLGQVTGDKYLGVKNTDAVANIFVDQTSPVNPSTAPYKIAPGKSLLIFTAVDTWFAISDTGTPQAVVATAQP